MSSFGESWDSEECSLRREIGVQRPSLRRRGHGESHHGRSDKRDAEEYALLNGSSPRSELKDPEHRHSLHELIGQDEDPDKG